MSTKHACILHVSGGKSGDGDDVKRFDKQSWQRVKYAEKARKLVMKSSKYFAIKLPEKYDDSFGYHTKVFPHSANHIQPDVVGWLLGLFAVPLFLIIWQKLV